MHILRKLAKETNLNEIKVPEETKYDVYAGLWKNGDRLVTYDPEQDLCTKKNDVETGEDQKGQ